MFAGLINHAKAAASHVVFMYLARASVAIPFVIALGFALAAITAMLVDRFGHVAAYWMVAGGLAVIGIIAALVVSSKEHEHEVAEKVAEQTNAQEVISDATAQALLQTPIALLGALFATPGGATTALRVVRALGRNYPLVLLAVMIGALFWPAPNAAAAGVAAGNREDEAKPNGFERTASYERERELAGY